MRMTNNPFPYFIFRLIIFAAVLHVFPVVVFADDTEFTAQKLINQMSHAARNLNYDGIFIYQRGGQMDTMRLIHKVNSDGEYERLVSLTGNAREVIRNNESVTCIFPDDKIVMVEKSRPGKFLSVQLPKSTEKIDEHYTFSITGQDRIAGQEAWVINIAPKDDYRYGYQLWINKKNYLLLKSVLKNSFGFSLEQMIFTQLEVLEDIPDELLQASITGKGYTWYNNIGLTAVQDKNNSHWQINWMPSGFSMSDYEKQPMAAAGNPVEHMVFTDGLAIVSVFIEKLGKQPVVVTGASKRGAVNTFARLANGYQVTAVGEVPQTTVEKMANSIVVRQ